MPLMWWVVALAFVGTFVVAIAVIVQPAVGIGVAVVAAAGVAAFLVGTAPVTSVDGAVVTVNGARLEAPYIGEVRTLNRDEARSRLGPGADARAHLVYRSYAEDAVEIDIADPADPHPYWLVSTRNPERLAAAIRQAAAVAA